MGGEVLCVTNPAGLRDSTVTYTISPSNSPLVLLRGSVTFVVMPTLWNGKTSVALGCLPTATRKSLMPDSSSLKPYQ